MQNPYFSFFTEIGIIAQLSRAMLEKNLPDGMSAPMFSVLNHLSRLGSGKTPLQIARAFQVPKTSMTHTLAGLERQGLIEMRPNPKDGRSKSVWLTDQGVQMREQCYARVLPEMQQLEKVFPPEFVAELTPKLADVRVWMDAARDGESGPE